jgi:ribosomal protein S27E
MCMYVAPNRLSLIFDESECNNCFIIYTRSGYEVFCNLIGSLLAGYY